ncbi:MAG: PAS domain S-box protein, partial [Verrucomicrobiota bacterium]
DFTSNHNIELENFIGSVPACIYSRELGGDFRFHFISGTISKLTGYTSEEFIAEPHLWLESISEKELEHVIARFLKATHAQEECTLEYHFRQANGEFRLLKDSFRIVEKDNSVLACGFLEDITDKKQNQESLNDALAEAEQFRLLFQISADMVCVTDFSGNFKVINPAWEGVTGYTEKELMETSLLDFLDPEDVDLTEQAFEKLYEPDEYLIGFENRFRIKDGSYVWLSWNASQYRDSGMIYSVVRDVTKMKKTIAALEESERNYQTLAETTPVGIFRATCEGKCFYVNPRFYNLTGRPRAELLDDGWKSSVHPDDLDELIKLSSIAMEASASFTHEFRFCKPDGSVIWVYGQADPERDAEGKITGLVGTITDITERKQLAYEHEKLSRLESLGVLAGGIAHDFNNMLSPILGNLSMAKAMLSKDSDIYECIDESERASIKARDLTQQLLTFAKGGAPVKRAADLKRLVQEATIFALHGSNVTAEFDFAEELMVADVDQSQINQVLQNLVINADQAMPDGGTVRVKVRNVDEVKHPRLPYVTGPFICIKIQDEGAGIHNNQLDRIFDPYYTTKSSGHGLGLATTLSIIRRHGGYLGVDSALEMGTTFKIFLPAKPGAEAEYEIEVDEDIEGNARILVMDDEKSVRQVMSNLLQRLGHEVECAHEGGVAVEMYREAKEACCSFDVVIMDLTVRGGIGGEKAIKMLKEYDPEARAIVFSGYSDNPVMADYESHGFSAAVHKPFTMQAIGKAIHRVLAASPVKSS